MGRRGQTVLPDACTAGRNEQCIGQFQHRLVCVRRAQGRGGGAFGGRRLLAQCCNGMQARHQRAPVEQTLGGVGNAVAVGHFEYQPTRPGDPRLEVAGRGARLIGRARWFRRRPVRVRVAGEGRRFEHRFFGDMLGRKYHHQQAGPLRIVHDQSRDRSLSVDRCSGAVARVRIETQIIGFDPQIQQVVRPNQVLQKIHGDPFPMWTNVNARGKPGRRPFGDSVCPSRFLRLTSFTPQPLASTNARTALAS